MKCLYSIINEMAGQLAIKWLVSRPMIGIEQHLAYQMITGPSTSTELCIIPLTV